MHLLIVILFFIGLSVSPTQAQKLSLAASQKLLAQLQQAGVLTPAGQTYFTENLLIPDTLLYHEYLNAFKPMGYFSFTSQSEKELDTTFVATPASLLAQFAFVDQIMMEPRENSLGNDDKKAIQKLQAKCKEWMGPLWLTTRIKTQRNQQDLGQLKTNFQSLNTALLRTKIIDQKVYEDVHSWIEKEEFKGDILGPSVFRKTAERSYYYESYALIRQEQLAYLDTLKQTGVLSDNGYLQLKQQYTYYHIPGPIDIISHCSKGFALDTKDLPADGLQALLHVYAAIQQKLIPDFAFQYQHSHNETFTDEEYGGTYTQEFLDFTIHNISYQQQSRFTPEMLLNRTSFNLIMGGQVTANDFKLVNDYLADQNSGVRLFIVDDKNLQEQTVGSRIGFILLDSIQAQLVDKALSLEIITFNSLQAFFDNSYNRTHLRQLIQEYQKIGIVPAMPSDTLENLVTKMVRDGVSSKETLLFSIPNVVARTDYSEFVYEGSEEEPQQVFTTFLKRLSSASQGKFQPSQVIDKQKVKGKNKRIYEWSFTLNGRTYSHTADDAHDFLWEEQFMNLVKKSLAESGIEGSFYAIGSPYQHYSIFLTPQQYQYLKANQPDLFSESHEQK